MSAVHNQDNKERFLTLKSESDIIEKEIKISNEPIHNLHESPYRFVVLLIFSLLTIGN